MSVKWIKITTDIFDNKKIKLIDTLPEADAIFRIWINLLVLAAGTNNNGMIYLSEKIPYTEEMLSTIFNKPINIVRLALQTFVKFEMITILENNVILLNDWNKHQNIEGLDKIREQNRIRQQRHLEKQKNALTNINKNKELDIDIEANNVKNNVIKEIIDYLNIKANKHFSYKNLNYNKKISGRIAGGFTVADFKKVIDIKCQDDWFIQNRKFLSPDTLFCEKNFEKYLNEEFKTAEQKPVIDMSDMPDTIGQSIW